MLYYMVLYPILAYPILLFSDEGSREGKVVSSHVKLQAGSLPAHQPRIGRGDDTVVRPHRA